MAIVKIERHDALIDTEEDEVKVNPFPQQEPSIEEHNVFFAYITVVVGSSLISRFASFFIVGSFVARNVEAFLGPEDLSILDLTILVSIHSKRLQSDLLQTYKTQVESPGYGKRVFGVLRFSNINGVLLEILCAICKSNKVHKTTEGLFSVTCQKRTTSYEIPKLQVKIKPSEGPVIYA
ncbi:hypothetical protein GOP47_0004166 [Adiantum capillus-veneris]|uniref:Uncharacterized protein n=1 Tax=Adiantum capillus-veneris TaxID=13818 RepID=A0A9D4V7E1_ADICA|nr:hypothetical protein GOP47_0004166 [Adiantum capillus-veneris]